MAAGSGATVGGQGGFAKGSAEQLPDGFRVTHRLPAGGLFTGLTWADGTNRFRLRQRESSLAGGEWSVLVYLP